MVGPSLSKIERERIQAAAKLAFSGAHVREKIGVDRLWYVVNGKEHEVLALSTNRAKFLELVRQAEAAYRADLEALNEEKQAKAQTARSSKGAMEEREAPALCSWPPLPDNRAGSAGRACGEKRPIEQGR